MAKIPNNQKKKTADYLKRIDYISVREDAGCRIIKQLTGRDVPMVVDPTILMAKIIGMRCVAIELYQMTIFLLFHKCNWRIS